MMGKVIKLKTAPVFDCRKVVPRSVAEIADYYVQKCWADEPEDVQKKVWAAYVSGWLALLQKSWDGIEAETDEEVWVGTLEHARRKALAMHLLESNQ